MQCTGLSPGTGKGEGEGEMLQEMLERYKDEQAVASAVNNKS